MSIQRWDIWGYEWRQDAHPDGDWVLYADHQEAMLNAELTHQREWLEARDAGVQAAREAVAALRPPNAYIGGWYGITVDEATTAIYALVERP